MDQAPGRFCQRSCRRPWRGARHLRTHTGHSGAARQLADAVHVTWRTVLIACLALGVALGIRWFIPAEDRKSTRLNSSHVAISYDVICLKKNSILSACTDSG